MTKAKGIYKPSGSEYALSIREVLNSTYADREPIRREDGTWIYQYFQEGENPSERDQYFTNRGLLACWRDSIPIGVLRQTKGKPHVMYHVLGMALVAGWDDGYFFLEGFSPLGHSQEKGPHTEIDVMRTALLDQAVDEFEPDSVFDSRRRVIASIMRRQGQREFREQLLRAYDYKCAVSGCGVIDTLEAAHIIPYKGRDTNHVSNGLLLRADLHTLFDVGKIAVDTSRMMLIISPELRESEYRLFDEIPLRLSTTFENLPSKAALDQHRLWTGL